MGLLRSIGKAFVEEVPVENQNVDVDTYSFGEDESIEAELDDVNTDTLIEDIYAQNDLFDKSQSIFKVEELINSLPKEMVTDTKRTSVLSILGNFGLTAMEMEEDGEKRISVLDAVSKKINSEGKGTIEDKESQIEELKKRIAALESEIADEQNEMKISNETISKETERVNELIKFIGGVN